MTTIYDYIQMATSDTPFKRYAVEPEPIVADDFQAILADFLRDNYGDYHIRPTLIRRLLISPHDSGYATALTNMVGSVCDNVYLSHEYTYNHLYNTTVVQYNPIENYDLKEHEEIKNKGEDKTTHNLGQHTDNTSYGESSVTDIYGTRHTITDTTGDVAPFESQSYQHVDKGTMDETQESATDKHTQSQRTDSTTYGGRVDTDTLDHGHEVERDLTRHGNIGTVTAQDMIKQEREIAVFNMVRIVANDIIHTLCLCVTGV